VFCDRTRIREILLNLLSNAGRFTERGGVRVRVWIERGDICVSVSDTGPGISPEALEKLFEPFQQGDGSIKRRYGGTGLGLSISKRFIELHDGKIWAASVAGAGTTVSFRFPIAPSAPTESHFMRGITPGWEYLQRTRQDRAQKIAPPRRFVVLEQGDALQRLLARYGAGAEIVPATTVAQALALTLQVPTRALLVNDVSITDALRRFSSGELPKSIPVIICSIPGADQESLSPAAQVRLVKPIDAEMLFAALARLDVPRGTVLIVDDEPDALQLFSRMLNARADDYRVLLARDGAEALTIAREFRPAVILLDLFMPKVDGFRFLEIQARDPELRDIPVVIISARDPSQQPIMSHALAVTQNSGLALPQLLACVGALSQILGVPDDDAPTPPTTSPD
jgi:CheY-like chemotaxis protein